MYKSIDILGYPVFCESLSKVDLSKKHLINTFSPNSYGVALSDKEFSMALKGSDLLVLDGVGIAVGSILLHGKNIKKVAGQDCFDYFMAEAQKNSWKVFFLGSSETTLQKIRNRVSLEYNNVITSVYSPPFKDSFSEEENDLMIQKVNSFKPDVLFVGMTAPKQEKWAYQNMGRLDTRIIVTIGNVFDWYAGNSKRPAKIWIDLRLEWLARLFMRPEILKRNTKNQLLYVRDVILVLFKLKKV